MSVILDTISVWADSLTFRIVLVFLVCASFGIYSRLNKRDKHVDVLVTWLDRQINLKPMFSVPYLLYFPYLFFVTGYGIIASPFFANIAASTLAVQLVAAAIYYMNQTYVPRPSVPGKDVFSRLTKFIYRFDEPYCAFPSLHVAYSVLCGYWAFVLFGPVTAALSITLTVAIVFSTLFLKQHVIADVIAGAFVATLSVVLLG
jgi:membrane-associated phospholipid phosphatase